MDKTMRSLKTYCIDIGSIPGGNFAWAGRSRDWQDSGTSIEKVATLIARDLDAGLPVSLGFECPLFVPFGGLSGSLGCARKGEGSRPWSANAGAASLTTGLVQIPWLLDQVKRESRQQHRAFLSWPAFGVDYRGLFVWEAFVSAKAKRDSHIGDAMAAIDAFIEALPNPRSCIECNEVHSLIGAALLRTKWTSDPSILSESAIVIRAQPRNV